MDAATMLWRLSSRAGTGTVLFLRCASHGCKLLLNNLLAAAVCDVTLHALTCHSLRRECVQSGRAVDTSLPQHAVRPAQLFKGLNVCLHQVSPVMQPGKMEEALISRGATVSFQVQQQPAAASSKRLRQQSAAVALSG